MSKGIKKIVLAMLSLVFVLSISLAVNANNFNAYAGTESATISTFDMSDVHIRSVDPTGIRFSTKVNKDYLDQDLSGKDVKFGTLIIPVDFFAKSEQAELTHAVADVMDVEQTTWGTELEDYYVFNAVLINMPSESYGCELMARSYAIIDGGEPIYSETTVTKSIGQVASEILVKYPAEEIEEEKEFFEAYVNESLKSVAFNEETIELAINETMPLSATTNPANYAVVYSVDDPSVISLENGVVKGLKTGVANVTATVGAISDTIEVTVSDAIVETFDGYADLSAWVANPYNASHPVTKQLVNENGNKYASFTVDGGYTITFNVTVPAQVQKDTWYIVSYDIWTESTIESVYVTTDAPCYNPDGKLLPAQKSTTFSMLAQLTSGGRLATFKMVCLASSPVTVNIDNMKFTPCNDLNGYAEATRAGKVTVDADTRDLVLENTGDWSAYRLYLDDLKGVAAGTVVKVTMKYKTVGATAANNQCLFMFGTNEGKKVYQFTPVKDGANYTTVEMYLMVFTGTGEYYDPAVISGSLTPHIKFSTLFNCTSTPAAVTGVKILIDSISAEVVPAQAIAYEAGNGTVTVNNDNFVLSSSGNWGKYRIYVGDLYKYVGQTVKVTMKYKTVGATVADNQYRIIFGKDAGTTTGFFDVVKDGSDYTTKEFEAMVYTGDGEYPTASVIEGSNVPHLKFTTLFTSKTAGVSTAGIQIIIDSITISAI